MKHRRGHHVGSGLMNPRQTGRPGRKTPGTGGVALAPARWGVSLVLVMLLLATGAAFAECPGDANSDGKRDIRDLVALLLYLQQGVPIGEEVFDDVDLNQNGVIDAGDMVLLQLHILGRKELPPCDSTENARPIADAGPNQVVEPGATVHLDATGSTDSDGDSLTYEWSFTSRPSGSTAVFSDAGSPMPTFVADMRGTYTVRLVVSDGHSDSIPDTVIIATANGRPTASAGPDQTVQVGTTVQLDGSGSSDPEGDPLTYHWTLTSRPGESTAALSDASAERPTFLADVAGTYVARLIVSDNWVSSVPDTATIVAEATQPACTVTFDDPNLDSAVRTALGLAPGAPITCELAATLTTLTASHLGIRSLVGLEACTGLTRLEMEFNEITDLAPLAGLGQLQSLDFKANHISDLTPLTGLHRLYALNFIQNQISDLTPLSGLTYMNYLVLSVNSITDISPLSGLTRIDYLHLSMNQISDISPLANLRNLQYVELQYNEIEDISPLAGNMGLRALGIHYNSIHDLSVLADFHQLFYLDIAHNPIDGIAPLSGLINLERLEAYEADIYDLTPLKDLTQLRELSLFQNRISDLAPLSGLSNLEVLYLDTNQISDVAPLLANPGLGQGDVVTLVQNLLGPDDCPALQELQARGVEVHHNAPCP